MRSHYCCAFERHKRASDLLVGGQLFFAIEMEQLQDWPATDGEQFCLTQFCLASAESGSGT
jgi:hypothetical protein